MNEQAAGAAAAVMGTGMIMIGIFWLLGIALFVTWIISIIDVIKSEFINPNDKTTWILLLIFIAPLATILYQTIGVKKKEGYLKPSIQMRKKASVKGEGEPKPF